MGFVSSVIFVSQMSKKGWESMVFLLQKHMVFSFGIEEIMKVAILDDNDFDRKSVKKYVEEALPDADIQTYKTVGSFLSSEERFSILFLDIDLGEDDGIKLSPALQNKCSFIIYITALKDRMQDAFGTNVIGYIIKSDNHEAIVSKIRTLVEKYCVKQLKVNVDGVSLNIPLDKIYRISKESRRTLIHLINETKGPFNISLQECKDAARDQLIYAYKSELVNVDHIAFIKGNIITFDNGSTLEVSRLRKDEIMAAFLRRQI